MILFDVKNDGTVTTVPMEMAQGAVLADLVVVTDAKYAFVTMRLVPPSGLYIPDIIFTRVKIDGVVMWKASLPPDAAMVEGSITYQIFLTDSTGEVLETPEGHITIPESIISDMPETVGELEQHTINELYALLAGVHDEMEENDIRLDNIDTRLRLVRVTVPTSEWTDGAPYQASVWLPGVNFGESEYTKAYTALLIPMDDDTRRESQKTELSVSETVSFTSGSVQVMLSRDNYIPTIDLHFAVAIFMIDNPEATAFTASASFAGVTELPDELMDREVGRVIENTVDPRLTALESYTQESIEELTDSVALVGKRSIISMVTIEPSAWSDSDPYFTFDSIFVGTDNPYSSATILLIPRDPQTRAEARKMELSVDFAYPSSVLLSFFMTRTEYAPTVPLHFAALTVLSDTRAGDGNYAVAASFVGVTELPDELMDKEVLSSIDRNLDTIAEKVLGQMPVYNGEVADV